MTDGNAQSSLKIGWAKADITPVKPVMLGGQFHARASEGVKDPLTATALALQSGQEGIVFASCDLLYATDELRDSVRSAACSMVRELKGEMIVINGTHTHTAPQLNPMPEAWRMAAEKYNTIDGPEYIAWASQKIASAIADAWNSRKPGGFSFGVGAAVVGRNRRWTNTKGVSRMYGDTNDPEFSHIEGWEDHSLNVLATHDTSGKITGLVVNIACPSQATEGLYEVSADYWHDTRVELRRLLGDSLFVLPQCSAAGDQSPHHIINKKAELRMLELLGRTQREEIAHRISQTVAQILPAISKKIDYSPVMRRTFKLLNLPVNALTEEDAATALGEAKIHEDECRRFVAQLEADPSLYDQPRWYAPSSAEGYRAEWFRNVAKRFEMQKSNPAKPVELHVLRLGDMVFSTNPFEYYLDFGAYIKARSSAVQTFLVQLCGGGTYVPSKRSQAGGGYGSIPASNPVGPEGGRVLAQESVSAINALFEQQ